MKQPVSIIGGGPAGSAAALAALDQGTPVRLYESARAPKQKVCGEFLSPEIAAVLEQLGVAGAFLDARPATIRRLELHLPTRTKRHALSESAYGFSRIAFDRLLLETAATRGAEVICQRADLNAAPVPLVLAHGRKTAAPRGRRLFGFKAHYSGPVDDSVELFFFQGGYAGVNTVEDSVTNVCALASEPTLEGFAWQFDDLLDRVPGIRQRLHGLTRSTNWVCTGPLEFQPPSQVTREACYPAGDALSFVDPFTGTGILAAVLTGRLAGTHAAQGTSVENYRTRCRKALGLSYRASSLLRLALHTDWVEKLAEVVPAGALVLFTRPRVSLSK